MKASDLLKALAWTRFDLLRAICRAREYGSRSELRTVTMLLTGFDQSLQAFAPDARAEVLRRSAAQYRESVWFSQVVAVAVPVGDAAGLPKYKFAGWVRLQLPVPANGCSVSVPPVVGDELVQKFRAHVEEVAA